LKKLIHLQLIISNQKFGFSNLEQQLGWIPDQEEDDFGVRRSPDVHQIQPSKEAPDMALGLAQNNCSGSSDSPLQVVDGSKPKAINDTPGMTTQRSSPIQPQQVADSGSPSSLA